MSNKTPIFKLYSKQSLILFSVIASPFFASFLMASNLKSMKKVKQIPMVILYALIFTFLVNGMMVNLGSSMSLFLIMGLNFLGGIVLNTFFWNEYLGKDITYEAKSIQKPVLIFALMLVLLMVLQGFMMRA